MLPLVNALAGQNSLYLQLHQELPVAWQPWGDDAFEYAQQRDLPILLTIGYSSCFWCHQMARDTYSQPVIAHTINRHFVPIAVDREERPDLDELYQMGHQILTGKPGAWPLNIFLCPQTRLPFFATTYQSSELGKTGDQPDTAGLGFKQLLNRVSNFYHKQHGEFLALRDQVKHSFEQAQLVPVYKGNTSQSNSSQSHANQSKAEASFVTLALQQLRQSMDVEHGGFGRAPKFPLPVNLLFLIRAQVHGLLPAEQAAHLHLTLRRIAERGINDRIGGGFFRYSKDDDWHNPHYEKMLCDNGLLLEVFAQASALVDEPVYRSAAEGIVSWLKRFMLSPQGAFFSSMSAESSGREGAYYCYPLSSIKKRLYREEFALFECMFQLSDDSMSPESVHLSQHLDLNDAAKQLRITRDTALRLYQSGREKLEDLRGQLDWPQIDPKILTSWNALAIKGLMVMINKLDDHSDLFTAQQALDAVCDNLWQGQRLFSVLQAEQYERPGLLDDYAYLMDALLESLQVQWRDRDYRNLIGMAESLLRLHRDDLWAAAPSDAEQSGGLFYTAADAEPLISRTKPLIDGALPAANGVAARVLLRLGYLAAEPRYVECAQRILDYAMGAMAHSPALLLTLVQVQQERLQGRPHVLIRDDGNLAHWQTDIRRNYGDRVACYCIAQEAEYLPPEAFGLELGEALVCNGDECLTPQTTRLRLFDQLNSLLD